MSECQSKKRSTSAEPRLVIDRTVCKPGTLFTASSIGLVIVTSIWSIGATPLSTPITTRGKSVLGKTDTGIEKARYAPTRADAIVKKMMGRENRSNHGGVRLFDAQWRDWVHAVQSLSFSECVLGFSLLSLSPSDGFSISIAVPSGTA